MKKSTEITGLPIISITEGRELGMSKSLLIDAQNGKVAAITIDDEDWYRGVKLLPYESVIAIGSDAVTITNSENILKLEDAGDYEKMLDENIRVIGTKAITRSGTIQGNITELFIGDRGAIEKCEITAPDGTTSEIEAGQISIFGKQVTVIDPEGEKKTEFTAVKPPAPKEEQRKAPTVPEAKPEPVPAAGQVKPEPAPAAPAKPEPEPTKDEAPLPEPKPTAQTPPAAAKATPTASEKPEPAVPAKAEPPAEKQETPIPDPATQKAPQQETPKIGPKAEAKPPAHAAAAPEAKPAPTAKPEPAPAKPVDQAKHLADKAAEERHRRFLLGKKATRRITTNNGIVIVEAGADITEEVWQKAKLANKVVELSMSVQ